jgi:anti-anti-sigma factor
MSESQVTISHRRDDEVEILEVRGELDLTNTDVLVDDLERTRARMIVLDLGLVVFVDSAGIRAIDHAHRELREEGRRLLVVAPPDSRAGWTFRIAGFDADAILDSVEAAERRASELDDGR